jgi:SapB morphogen precursor RamS
MALLDIQAMDPARDGNDARWGGGSELSVTLCDSTASFLLCL